MAYSYNLYTANGSTTDFSLVGIDGWISSGFLKVYVNDTLVTTGYTFQDLTTAAPFVRFTTAPANLAQVRLQRETPNTVAGFQANVVDFNDGSVLTASDLDKVVTGLVHVTQESEDIGSGALGLTVDETNWNAASKRITNMDDGLDAQDAVTMNQFNTATLYGGSVAYPQVWAHTGTGSNTYALSPLPLSTTSVMFLVEVGGVIQHPDTYDIVVSGTTASIVFDAVVASGVAINIRNLGVARNINESVTTSMLQDSAVTTAKINASAVTTAKIADSNVTTAKIADDAVTYAKMQNVSATDKVLGRSTAGAGNVEEITCTAAGRALLDDADATAQRTTLGLTAFATKAAATIADADIAATAAIGYGKFATMIANGLLGNPTAAAATPTGITCTAFARSLLDDADAATARATLGAVGASSTSNSVVTNAGASATGLAIGQWCNFVLTPSELAATGGLSIGATGQNWLLILSRQATACSIGAYVTSGVVSANTICAAIGMPTGSSIGFIACRIS